jgi:hypothetical protein
MAMMTPPGNAGYFVGATINRTEETGAIYPCLSLSKKVTAWFGTVSRRREDQNLYGRWMGCSTALIPRELLNIQTA